MSVVPYNLNNRVIYHYPGHGVLVLHNKVDNTLQLISQNNGKQVGVFNLDKTNGRSGIRRGSNFHVPSEDESFVKCPNCGFSWAGQFPPNATTTGPGDRSHGGEFSNTPVLGSSGALFDQEFMHQDYFKLLSRLPATYSLSLSDEPKVKPPKGLPEQIFNQDYFKRFFKKVPPYELGSGAHAHVYKVVHVLNNIPLGTYAVKRISIGDKIEFLEQVLKEVLILYELSLKGANENNLIRYNHVWLELGDILDLKAFVLPASESSSPEFQNKVPYVFILQQYCDGGDLEGIIKKNFPLDAYSSYRDKVERERMRRRLRKRKNVEEKEVNGSDSTPKWLNDFEIWKFFKDVITGVSYLHVHGILHRDLKPSNCLIEAKYEINSCATSFSSLKDLQEEVERIPKILVSDFGEGKFTDKHSITEPDGGLLSIQENKERKGNTGTLEFTAPELWMLSIYDPANQKNEGENRFTHDFTYESDIYLLGMILCWLCLGELPFSAAIYNEQDPEASRNKIILWYKELTQSQFEEWFSQHKKISSNALDDFAHLIYSMIKGHDRISEDHKRILLPDVVGLIDGFKFKYFIQLSSPLSTVCETEVAVATATATKADTDGFTTLEQVDSCLNEDSLSIRDSHALNLVAVGSDIKNFDSAEQQDGQVTSVSTTDSSRSTDFIGSYVIVLAIAAAIGTVDISSTSLYVILAVLVCLLADTYLVRLQRYRAWILMLSFLLVLSVGFNLLVSTYQT